MSRHRTAAAVFAGVVPLLLTGLTTLTAGPAYAHGAPTDPVSRVSACGPEGGRESASAACRAAVTANGGQTFDAWDNMRIADVNGRDRQVVPDGQLCSAGLDAYQGLDLAREDWPATRLAAGADFSLTYRTTIPHTGTFSLYLTREGYDPTSPLTWADLAPTAFITATDPPVANGAYHISGKLPEDRTGRHVIYTVWRNTSTPDTYYSCSDVVFPKSSAGRSAPRPPSSTTAPRTASPTAVRKPAAGTPAAQRSREAAAPPTGTGTSPAAQPVPEAAAPRADPVSAGAQSAYLPVAAGGVMAVVGIGIFVMLRRRAQ
jgi:predicted carbohydrate-binding protein with CBM5 and CBM33 domain